MAKWIEGLKISVLRSSRENQVFLRFTFAGSDSQVPPILKKIIATLREGKKLTVLSNGFPEDATILSLAQVIINQGSYDPEVHPSVNWSADLDGEAGWTVYYTLTIRDTLSWKGKINCPKSQKIL